MPLLNSEVPSYQKELRSFLFSNARIQENLTRTARLIQSTMQVSGVFFVFLDANNEFRIVPGYGISPEDNNSAFLDDEIVFSDSSLIVQDATRDYRFANDNWVRQMGIRMYVSIPLRTRDQKHIGLVCLTNRRRQDFSVEDLGILLDLGSMVTEQAELQFENFKFEEQIAVPAGQVSEGDDTTPTPVLEVEEIRSENDNLQTLVESDLLDALPLPTMAINAKGKIIYWNQTCIDVFGYDKEEIESITISKLLQEKEQAKELRRLIKRVFNRRRISGKTIVFASKEGEPIVTKGRFYPVYRENNVECCLLVSTVTSPSGGDINPWFIASMEKSIFTNRCSVYTFTFKLYSNETISIESCSREFALLTGRNSGITRIPLEEWVHSEDLFKWIPRFSDMQAGQVDMLSYRVMVENERTIQVRDTVAITQADLDDGSLMVSGVLEFLPSEEEFEVQQDLEEQPEITEEAEGEEAEENEIEVIDSAELDGEDIDCEATQVKALDEIAQ